MIPREVYFVLSVCIVGIAAQADFPASIPSNITECYYNATLNNRYNRGPFSMDELIALIRKVEAHPTAQRWTVQKLTGVILRRFRYDGIKDAPGSNAYVTPITKEEVENDKYKLMWSLLPGQPFDFPEDSLTLEEKCTMHWILSYSVNRTQRSEERQVRQSPYARLSDSSANVIELLPYRGPEFESLYSSLPLSASPLEMGVVYTTSGTVSAGNVLAGILTGLAPQTVSIRKLLPASAVQNWQLDVLERNIDSRWAVTLAGNLGQTALLRRPPDMSATGPRGSWNNTACPKEYALEESDPSYLTTAEIYGSIDGLILSLKRATWDKDYIRLSSLLSMYYSDRGITWDKSLRACNRLSVIKDTSVFDPNLLKEQSTSCALAYFVKGMAESPSIPNNQVLDAVDKWVSYTYDVLRAYLRSSDETRNDFQQCTGVPVITNTTNIPATYTDLTVVIDQYNDDRSIWTQKQAIAYLAAQLNIQQGGSRLELVSSEDGTQYMSLNQTLNKAQLGCDVLNANIRSGGRLFGSVMSALRNRIVVERRGEINSTISGGNARVVLFLSGSGSPVSNEKDLMRTELPLWARDIPDVRILFVTTGSKEEYKEFVTNYDMDILQIYNYNEAETYIKSIRDRLVLVPARLTHPNCNTHNTTIMNSTPYEASYQYTSYVSQGTIQYFMVRPDYFFSSSVITLKFTVLYGYADICMSRINENPTSADTCKRVSQSGQSVQFDITSPCGRARSPTGCSPIYIAIKAEDQDDGIPCSDTNCLSPDQIRFTYAHDGMLCNKASLQVASVLTVFLSLWIALIKFVH